MSKKELDKIIKEVRSRMNYTQPKKSNKGWLIGLGITVVVTLVGLVLWIRSKNDEDIEEYYEYFDDEVEDELDDDELYGIIDEDEENEEVDNIEYVNIKTFGENNSDSEEDEEELVTE